MPGGVAGGLSNTWTAIETNPTNVGGGGTHFAETATGTNAALANCAGAISEVSLPLGATAHDRSSETSVASVPGGGTFDLVTMLGQSDFNTTNAGEIGNPFFATERTDILQPHSSGQQGHRPLPALPDVQDVAVDFSVDWTVEPFDDVPNAHVVGSSGPVNTPASRGGKRALDPEASVSVSKAARSDSADVRTFDLGLMDLDLPRSTSRSRGCPWPLQSTLSLAAINVEDKLGISMKATDFDINIPAAQVDSTQAWKVGAFLLMHVSLKPFEDASKWESLLDASGSHAFLKVNAGFEGYFTVFVSPYHCLTLVSHTHADHVFDAGATFFTMWRVELTDGSWLPLSYVAGSTEGVGKSFSVDMIITGLDCILPDSPQPKSLAIVTQPCSQEEMDLIISSCPEATVAFMPHVTGTATVKKVCGGADVPYGAEALEKAAIVELRVRGKQESLQIQEARCAIALQIKSVAKWHLSPTIAATLLPTGVCVNTSLYGVPKCKKMSLVFERQVRGGSYEVAHTLLCEGKDAGKTSLIVVIKDVIPGWEKAQIRLQCAKDVTFTVETLPVLAVSQVVSKDETPGGEDFVGDVMVFVEDKVWKITGILASKDVFTRMYIDGCTLMCDGNTRTAVSVFAAALNRDDLKGKTGRVLVTSPDLKPMPHVHSPLPAGVLRLRGSSTSASEDTASALSESAEAKLDCREGAYFLPKRFVLSSSSKSQGTLCGYGLGIVLDGNSTVYDAGTIVITNECKDMWKVSSDALGIYSSIKSVFALPIVHIPEQEDEEQQSPQLPTHSMLGYTAPCEDKCLGPSFRLVDGSANPHVDTKVYERKENLDRMQLPKKWRASSDSPYQLHSHTVHELENCTAKGVKPSVPEKQSSGFAGPNLFPSGGSGNGAIFRPADGGSNAISMPLCSVNLRVNGDTHHNIISLQNVKYDDLAQLTLRNSLPEIDARDARVFHRQYETAESHRIVDLIAKVEAFGTTFELPEGCDAVPQKVINKAISAATKYHTTGTLADAKIANGVLLAYEEKGHSLARSAVADLEKDTLDKVNRVTRMIAKERKKRSDEEKQRTKDETAREKEAMQKEHAEKLAAEKRKNVELTERFNSAADQILPNMREEARKLCADFECPANHANPDQFPDCGICKSWKVLLECETLSGIRGAISLADSIESISRFSKTGTTGKLLTAKLDALLSTGGSAM